MVAYITAWKCLILRKSNIISSSDTDRRVSDCSSSNGSLVLLLHYITDNWACLILSGITPDYEQRSDEPNFLDEDEDDELDF